MGMVCWVMAMSVLAEAAEVEALEGDAVLGGGKIRGKGGLEVVGGTY